MKFRRLNIEELSALEPEFIQFLSANTVTAADWQQLKAEETEKANELIDVFSDLVFEKIIKNVQYLDFKTPNDIKSFHCTDDKIYLRGLQFAGSPNIDLRDWDQMMNAIQSTELSLHYYAQEKNYLPNRETELFRMIQNGASISKDGQLFDLIQKK